MKRVLLALALTACSTATTEPTAPPEEQPEPTFGGARPVTVRVPEGYDPKKPAPLVLMLHGYGSASILTDYYWKMTSVADLHGFFYVAPNGTFDKDGKRFWNATDRCCDFARTGVDDVAYLTSVIKEIQAAYSIDPKRIYVMGHSNGGFMTNRLACERADLFAAGVSFAGATWSDPSKCSPSAPLAMLQIHGTKDESVSYDGEESQPGAKETVALWAAKNECADKATELGSLHVNADGTGQETKVSRHDGCKANGSAELWRVENAPHVFAFTPESVERIWTFLETHAKP